MKNKLYLLGFFLSFATFSNAQKTNLQSSFTINGIVLNEYSGYLYFHYNDKKDSCIVKNNKFYFEGSIKNTQDVASFSTGKPAAMEKEFYIENKNIDINITIKKKTITRSGRESIELDWITVNSIKGTKTALIEKEYEKCKFYLQNDNTSKLFYKKLNDIISKNNKNKYCGYLISSLSWNEKLDKNELKRIYSKLDKKYQDESTIRTTEANLYPQKYIKIKIDDPVFNFELPNEKDYLFDTSTLKGKWFLIDFWASWCGPCRKQLPDLKKVYETYKNKNFEIVAVSMDKDKNKWIEALNKEKLDWINVNENKGFYGNVANKYSVFAIPANYLIDPSGKIIDKDISPENLEKLLKENL